VIVSSLAPGAFTANGVYVLEPSSAPSVPPGPATQTLVIVGGATDGQPDTPIPFSGAQSLFAKFGTGTRINKSLVRAALSAMPECGSFYGIRRVDGTQTNAVANLQDAQVSPGNVLVITARQPGSEANQMIVRSDLQSGTPTAGPIYSVSISYPNQGTTVYPNIIASATAGGAFAAGTFQANALAAINGTAPNTVPSDFYVASAGSSTTAPATGVNFTAAGGTDGASALTDVMLLGTDGSVNRRGAYAAKGVSFGGIMLAGAVDPTQAIALAQFAQSQGAVAFYPFAAQTETGTAVTSKTANSMSNRFLILCEDWIYVNDANSGTQLLVPPTAKVAGTIMGLEPYQDPTNKPKGGAFGILATEKTRNSQPIDPSSEGAQRQQNGILYWTKSLSGSGGTWRLPHGYASDGSRISDTRMLNFIAQEVDEISGQFLGEMQTSDVNDEVRGEYEGVLHAFFQSLLSPVRKIDTYSAISDSTNNSLVTIQQGILRSDIFVRTLTGIGIIISAVRVGNTVQVQAKTA
jgi:hypothetical protein